MTDELEDDALRTIEQTDKPRSFVRLNHERKKELENR